MRSRFNFGGHDSAGDTVLDHATTLEIKVYRGDRGELPTVEYKLSGILVPDDPNNDETSDLLQGGTVADPLAIARKLLAAMNVEGGAT